MKTFLILVLLLWSRLAHGQPGTLDPAFGVGGVAIVDAGSEACFTEDMLIQPDGKFLLLVRRYGILILVRVLPSGSVDPSFGVDGVASSGLPEGSGTYGPSGGMSLQTDGSILIASFHHNGSNADFALVRLTEA
jgi:hypothetical protein